MSQPLCEARKALSCAFHFCFFLTRKTLLAMAITTSTAKMNSNISLRSASYSADARVGNKLPIGTIFPRDYMPSQPSLWHGLAAHRRSERKAIPGSQRADPGGVSPRVRDRPHLCGRYRARKPEPQPFSAGAYFAGARRIPCRPIEEIAPKHLGTRFRAQHSRGIFAVPLQRYGGGGRGGIVARCLGPYFEAMSRLTEQMRAVLRVAEPRGLTLDELSEAAGCTPRVTQVALLALDGRVVVFDRQQGTYRIGPGDKFTVPF